MAFNYPEEKWKKGMTTDQDPVATLRSSIVNLDGEKQREIATFAMRNLAREDQQEVVAQVVGVSSQAELESSFRSLALSLGVFVIMLCLGVLVVTVIYQPKYIEIVTGTITTIAGIGAGFVAGRYSPGNQGNRHPEDR